MSAQLMFLRAINVGGHASVKMSDLRHRGAPPGRPWRPSRWGAWTCSSSAAARRMVS